MGKVSKTKAMLAIFQIWILLNVSNYFVHCGFSPLRLPKKTSSPDSAAFDPKGGGPYACVGDGRVVKYEGPNVGFTEFATASPNRSKERCDGTNDPLSQEIWGRENEEGITMLRIKFSPTSLKLIIVLSGDTSGRLFKYDIATKQVTLLLDKLSGPAGVALSKDSSYVLVTEVISKKIRRFWLKGAKANSSDVFANTDGNPDNIKWTISGDFWVAVGSIKIEVIIPILVSTGERLNQLGEVVETRDFTAQYPGITEVQEHDGKLYVGSSDDNFIGVDGV